MGQIQLLLSSFFPASSPRRLSQLETLPAEQSLPGSAAPSPIHPAVASSSPVQKGPPGEIPHLREIYDPIGRCSFGVAGLGAGGWKRRPSYARQKEGRKGFEQG